MAVYGGLLILRMLIGLLVIKSHQMNVNIRVLLGAVAMIAVANMISIMENIYLISIGQVLIALGFLLIFLHYEAMINRKPNLVFWSILIAGFVMGVVNQIISLYYWTMVLEWPINVDFNALSGEGSSDLFIPFLFFTRFYTYTILIMLILLRALWIIRRIHHLAQIRATQVETIGICLLLLYRSLFFPRFFVSEQAWFAISSVALGVSIIGVLIVLFNYLVHADYIHLLPFPIHSFMVYSQNGLLRYARKVEQSRAAMGEQDHLISGAFTAISALIKQTLGGQAKIEYIDAHNYQIYFTEIPQEGGTLVVIAYGDTALFSQSLKRCVDSLPDSLLDSIKSMGGDVTEMESLLDAHIQRSFPYVHFAKDEELIEN